jgi:hypothetical protein
MNQTKQTKKLTKKLTLNTETIKQIDVARLGEVAGGYSYSCGLATCR